jgi:hypothetical protein
MVLFRREICGVILGSLCLFTTPGVSAADDSKELATRLKTAREKYSELQEARAAYAARSEIAGAVDALERQRADLLANIREHQIELDAMPRLRNGAPGRNSVQEGVNQELLMLRRELTGLDRTLEEFLFRLREQDELALRQAELTGRRVKPGARRDLLPEIQRLEKECLLAFGALKDSVNRMAGQSQAVREEILRKAIAAQDESADGAVPSGPPQAFLAAFGQFCSGKRPRENAAVRRPYGARTRRAAGGES